MKFTITCTIVLFTFLTSALANENSFVTGGKKVSEGQFPWQVRLLEGNEDNSGFCGGSVIAPDWVLTAAHCISDFMADGDDEENADSENYQVEVDEGMTEPKLQIGFGSANLSKLGRVNAKTMLVHPHYKNGRGPDIALIQLDSSLPKGLVVPLELKANPPEKETKVWVTGWGAQMDDSFDPTLLLLYNMANGKQIRAALDGSNISVPNDLRMAELKIMDHNSCSQTYNALNNADMTIDAGEICVGDPGTGKDSCYGDSGGPLVIKNPDKSFTQIGVVSWGYQCGNPLFPGVYASTAAYSDWIEHAMKSK